MIEAKEKSVAQDEEATVEPVSTEQALANLRAFIERYEAKYHQRPKWALMSSQHPLAAAGLTSVWGVLFHIEDGVVFLSPDDRPELRIEGSECTLHSEHPMSDPPSQWRHRLAEVAGYQQANR